MRWLRKNLIPIIGILVLIYLWIVGFSNAINLTDGLDGLAVGCTITVALVFGIMAYLADNIIAAQYLLLSYVPGTSELTVICGALIGAEQGHTHLHQALHQLR